MEPKGKEEARRETRDPQRPAGSREGDRAGSRGRGGVSQLTSRVPSGACPWPPSPSSLVPSI